MKPSKVKEKIKHLLIFHPHLRDDDYKLIANVWHGEIKDMGLQTRDALVIYSQGSLTPAESITRCRRKLQELNPEIRGQKYRGRQEEQVNVINDLRINF